jgi:hypothetical protein
VSKNIYNRCPKIPISDWENLKSTLINRPFRLIGRPLPQTTCIALCGGAVYQWQLDCLYGNLNAQRYRNKILRLMVVPFICCHHPMSQGSVHNSWKLKMSVRPWPAYSPDMSPTKHVWGDLDWRVRQRVSVPANIQQLHAAVEQEWDNILRDLTNSLMNSICEGDVSHCMSQMVLTSDTDWFSDPRTYFKKLLFIFWSVTNRCVSVFPVMWNT